MSDEYLDLVDASDQVIGQKLRSEIYAEGLRNFRAVNLFLINSQGKLWVPRRSATKREFPLGLDISMGGHVASGETYEEALFRETKEELNLDLATLPYRYLGKAWPAKHGVYCFSQVYELQTDEVPPYNPEDFVGYFWLKPGEVLQKIETGEVAKSDLPLLIKLFYV